MAVEGSNGNLIASDKVEGTVVGAPLNRCAGGESSLCNAEEVRWPAEIEVRNCLS